MADRQQKKTPGRPFRVLISDSMSAVAAETLSASDAVEVVVRAGISADDLVKEIGEYHGLLVRSRTNVTDAVIAAADNLAIIGRAGIGVDNIDIASASRRGIIVENAPSGNSATTAEHAICLLLALARNIPQATASMKAGKWEKNKLGGRELLGKSFGVIGLGNIGRLVAERGRGLKMKVIGYDPFIGREDAARLGVELLELDEVLARADFITVHTPLTAQTRGMLGADAFRKVKPGLLLVNAARGGIVDEVALHAALESGQVAGAAIDVFEEEPPPADHPLVNHPNVICTPHLGASTDEAQEKVALEIAAQIVAFAERGDVINTINTVPLSVKARAELEPWMKLGTSLGALASQRVADHKVVGVEIQTSGVPAEGRDVVTLAVLVGVLRRAVSGPVNPVNAEVLAKELGVSVEASGDHRDHNRASAISVRLRTGSVETTVKGTLFHSGEGLEPRIVQLDDVLVEAPAAGHLLVVRNRDRPGVIGRVGTLLGDASSNVNSLHVGQDAAGDVAVSLWNLAMPLTDELLASIRGVEDVISAEAISL